MKETGIIFTGESVRAILAGTKTQTRRVVTGRPLEWLAPEMFVPEFVADPSNNLCPYGYAGDRLWVRETWGLTASIPVSAQRQAIKDGFCLPGWLAWRADDPAGNWCWRSPIFMPRWASRITLEVTGVRVERVQEISEEDAWAEGVLPPTWETDGLCFSRDHQHIDARPAFACLWDSINAKRGYSWESNPFCWAITFRRINP